MSIFHEQTNLDKKPTWYLFLISNVLVLLSTVITFLLFKNKLPNTMIYYVPSLVCNLTALALCALFIFLEAKSVMPKAVHFQRKWIWWYLAAIIVFISSIIFAFVFFVCFNNFYWGNHNVKLWPLYIYIAITGLLTLVAIGLQRYARYKIDLDIYKRNRGQLPKKDEIMKDLEKIEKSKQKVEKDRPTSGLADSISK